MLVGTAPVGSGIEWPKMTIRGTNTHVFAVGDWGGLAGTLPHNSQIIQYKGGDQGLWWLEWLRMVYCLLQHFFWREKHAPKPRDPKKNDNSWK